MAVEGPAEPGMAVEGPAEPGMAVEETLSPELKRAEPRMVVETLSGEPRILLVHNFAAGGSAGFAWLIDGD